MSNKLFEDMECQSCKKKEKCIEQAYCDHILCLECFKFAHKKPGNDECPICYVSREKVINNMS